MDGTDKRAACANRRWRTAAGDELLVAGLAAATGLSRIAASVLAMRDVRDADAARAFLDPDLQRDWLSPDQIPGMSDAAARVAAAVRDRSRIVVFGDFDLDGISAAAVAGRGLAALGAEVEATVPNRFTEGYGLTDGALERLMSLRPDLVVTVDCGISSRVEAERLRAAGIDVVVTDHHEPGGEMPVGVPVANPKLDGSCRSSTLAGAGVALKLVQAVGEILGEPDVWRDLADLAMLGTVADIVPLVGENRALVAAGLSALREWPRVGLAALCGVAGVAVQSVTSENVAFALAPRLNAAGRMADACLSLELLLCDDPLRAEELAHALDEHNRVRQAVEHDLAEAAFELAGRTFAPGDKGLVLSGQGWHPGVKGIVASRLAGAFGVPVLLFAIEDGLAVGSGRSVGRVDLYSAVAACADHLERFGGHEAAVGVTVRAKELPAFTERLLAELARVPDERFVEDVVCEAELELEQIGLELAAELDLFEPYGHGNPRPLFCSHGVFMNARQRVGRTGNHLRFTAFDGISSVPAIAFRCREIETAAAHDASVDLAYEVHADEWRGRKRVQLIVRDYEVHERTAGYAPAADLVEDLFSRADELLAREEYIGIEDAESFHTKLVGVTFEGRQDTVSRLAVGTPLRTERQPDNMHDPCAIALVDPGGMQVGFFNRRLAAVLAPVIDAGVEYDVVVSDVTGGEAGRTFGVNVLVSRRGRLADESEEQDRAERRAEYRALTPEALQAHLVQQFIGSRSLHEAQVESLEVLAGEGRCLTVMATGRGKSLIFHLHAARRALLDGLASVFVYPLRALVADQAFHLEESFAGIGLEVVTLTGESTPSRRDEVFAGLADGGVDVVLTTPEFLDHHAGRFARSGRVGFVVVDEAHHVAAARAGHRPSYGRLGRALEIVGAKEVLAVTATASADTAAAIREGLGIARVVEDPTVRENLIVEDRRGLKDKDDYLVALAARGEKVVVYVNSREQSVRLARMMRKRVPVIAMRVAFYNGGLGRQARHAVERAFRDGDLSVVVATSAFGEGVNIPDIRHVVLYHLPFNEVEFNQMCGRSGRDGAPARVHLLFGSGDARVNEMVLSSAAPSREDMVALYRLLKAEQDANGPGFEITNAELAGRLGSGRGGLNERGVSSAIGVFRELGLVEGEGHGPYRRLTVPAAPDRKLDLAESVRYAEGLEEIAEFDEFRRWVLEASADELLVRFNRPILPSSPTAPKAPVASADTERE